MEINVVSPSSSQVNKLIWIVNLCSISASTLSYIYLSWFVYNATNNLIYSQAVLFAPMILPVIFVNIIKKIAERYSPGRLLLLSNLLAAVCTLIVFFLLAQMPLIALVGGVFIGSIDALQRVGRIVAIKYYFTADKIESTVPLTLTAQFIAGGLAGMLMALFRGYMTPGVAMWIIEALFLFSVLASMLLPAVVIKKVKQQRTGSLKQLMTLFSANPPLKKAFLRFVVFITFFQGFFNVSRVTLPSHVLGLTEGYVGLLQVVNSTAALAGAVLYYIYNKRGVAFNPLWMSVLSALFMVISAFGVNITLSYLAFFFYIFFFELTFFRLQSDIVKSTASQDMPAIASLQYAGVYAGMIASIFAGSVLTSNISLAFTAMVFVAGYFIITEFRTKH